MIHYIPVIYETSSGNDSQFFLHYHLLMFLPQSLKLICVSLECK